MTARWAVYLVFVSNKISNPPPTLKQIFVQMMALCALFTYGVAMFWFDVIYDVLLKQLKVQRPMITFIVTLLELDQNRLALR